ncbi:MAG: CBS domain-containing protein [Halobacteriaceae archaeon]
MDDVFVGSVMSTALQTVTPDTLVEDAAGQMLDHDIGSVVVVDESGGPVGILTSTDFVRIVAERQPKDQTPVERYMSTGLVTATAQDTVEAVADRMLEHGVHHIPVVDDGDLIGILSSTDMASYLAHDRRP